MWRFRGTPYYLEKQAARLGITPVLADRARHNPEIFRVGSLMAQLSACYHHARKESGKPVFSRSELGQIKGTLEQCELELQKLHMLAAASDTLLADAWQAFGFEAPRRIFEVTSESDTQILPLGDGTVGVPDDLAPALSESG